MSRSAIKAWLGAARLRTLPLALSSIGMGGFMAAFYQVFNLKIFILCVLTTVFLQVLSNFANDYGDSVHGADSEHRQGPSRAVQRGEISSGDMRMAIIIASILSLISGLLLLYFSFRDLSIYFLIFLILGLTAIGAAIKYTAGSRPYGYSGLGDLSVFIFFGFLGVMGTFFLQALFVDMMLILPSCACGAFSTGVLNVNNMRDIDSDRKAGKYSIPVRIGLNNARVYHCTLLLSGFIAATIFVYLKYTHPVQFIFLLVAPLFIKNGLSVLRKEGKHLDPYLKQLAVSSLLFVILFGIGNLIAIL